MEGPLKNSRHERFAVLVANGKTQADAYREVYPNQAGQKASTLATNACRLHTKVLPRIRELQQKAANKAGITRDELVEIMAEIVRTPGDAIPAGSRIVQEVRAGKFGSTVVIPSKVQAADFIAKVLGFYAPQKVENEHRFSPDEAVAARIGEELARLQGKKGKK